MFFAFLFGQFIVVCIYETHSLLLPYAVTERDGWMDGWLDGSLVLLFVWHKGWGEKQYDIYCCVKNSVCVILSCGSI